MKTFEAIVKIRHSAHGHIGKRRMEFEAEDRVAALGHVLETACTGGYAGYRVDSVVSIAELNANA
jgi:hypothetical protein